MTDAKVEGHGSTVDRTGTARDNKDRQQSQIVDMPSGGHGSGWQVLKDGGDENLPSAIDKDNGVDLTQNGVSGSSSEPVDDGLEVEEGDERDVVVYKTYKRRWFGLVQLTLLNIIVSWDVSLVFSCSSQLMQALAPSWTFLRTYHNVYIIFNTLNGRSINTYIVAHVRTRILVSSHLLQHLRNHRKLALNPFPLLLRRRHPFRDLRPARRPQTLHYHRSRPRPRRKLDSVCGVPRLLSWHLRGRRVRADPHRSSPAICPLRSSQVLRSLVLAQGKGGRHRRGQSGKPLWCGFGTVDCSVLGGGAGECEQDGAICGYHLDSLLCT